MSEDDRRLLSHVRPSGWRNPTPQAIYDLLVIGGGTAGLVCAAGAAGLGARVALVERSRLGGDCLNTGCVPSKALLHASRQGANLADAMAYVRSRRADIAPHDSAARLASIGVDVFFGDAAFTDPAAVMVRPNGAWDSDGSTEPNVLTFRKAVIATGSRPAVPPIAALANRPFLTSDTIWDVTEPPQQLTVVGGGPIGCELAQAFARLGSRVTLMETAPQLLPREDRDAADLVARALQADGVSLTTGAMEPQLPAREVLVATGRTPNVDGLGLDAAGVGVDADGIIVDDRLRTTNPRIYAAGDIASRFKFTHAADALARLVIRNALFFGRRRAADLVIPWCTFTDPEVAHVGVNSREAAAQRHQTITIPLSDVDRAVVDDRTDGFVRLHHDRGRITGATIVAPAAGEMIATVGFAMQHGHTLAQFADAVVPYPTFSLALRQAGDVYRRGALTPAIRRALRYYFRR